MITIWRRIFLNLLIMLLIAGAQIAYSQDDNPYTLTILHTNDVHGRVAQFSASGSRCTEADAAENRCFGGVARRATIINRVRAETDNVLLLDAGDQFQGTLFYTQYKGEEAMLAMNRLGYDAMAVGNHEFDDGPETLATFIRGVQFPLLSANIDASNEPSLAGLIQPYAVLEVGGERIGIVGYTTEDTAILSSPGPNLRFLNIENTVQAAVAELESAGINKVIAVSHAGFGRDRQVAGNVSGIDVIVAGHTNTYLSNTDATAEGPYPVVVESPEGKPVLLVSAFAYGKYLGRLDVAFDAGGVPVTWEGNPILLDASVAQEPELLALVEELQGPLRVLQQQVVGTTTTPLDGDRASCRFAECTMGNLVADAILWMTAAEGTQIAIVNGGSIRSSIAAGEVTLGDVLEVLPFSNTIATFELAGADLWAALENGVSRANSAQNEGTGRFPQVAGLRYTWNPDSQPGSRIAGVEVRNPDGSYTPIDPEKTYLVATNDFLRRGGDGYTTFAEKAFNPYDAGANLEEAVALYITTHSPVTSEVEGRILQTRTRQNPIFSLALLLLASGFGVAGISVLARREAKPA